MLFLIFIVVLLYIIYSWLTVKPKNFPPGPPTVPLLGSIPFLPKKNVHFEMEKWNKQYGGIVGLMLGNNPAVAICNSKLARELLKRDEFQGRMHSALLEERSFNRRLGIMFTDGPAWQEQRRFAVRHLKDLGLGKTSMESTIIEEIEEVIEEVKGKTLQVSNMFNLSSVNVIWAVVAGTRYKHSDPFLQHLMSQLNEFFRAGKLFGSAVTAFPFLRHFIPDRLNRPKITIQLLQAFFLDVIKQHEEILDKNNPCDFIDVYLSEMQSKEDPSYDVENLITICLDLFSAGGESVGNTLGFCLMYMVLYPEVQEKVQQELDNLIGRGRKPSLQDRASLPYTEAVLLEVMRCNTIAPSTVPHRVTENTTVNGYFVPKDCLVFISLWSIMQDKEHWSDPEHFRPSRFINENGKLIKDDFLIPFGIGKRVCPGEALARNVTFLFFTSLLQEYTIILPPGHEKPSTVCLSGFTTAPQPFEVTFQPR